MSGSELKWLRSEVNGYPGDEHVFSVVVIVLARSPDCNSHILVTLSLSQLCCRVRVCIVCVFHLLAGLWAVKVSVVSLCKVCRASCVSCRLIPKQQLTSDAAAVKRTAVFTYWVDIRLILVQKTTRYICETCKVTSIQVIEPWEESEE